MKHEKLFFFYYLERIFLWNNFFPQQIWYEVTCDIPQDTELLLGPKVPLLISDMGRETDERSGSGLCLHFMIKSNEFQNRWK